MGRYVLDFEQIDATQISSVGGKAAGLGELSRISGVRVPPGFCVTTDAFRLITENAPRIDEQLERLSRLRASDQDAIREIGGEIRRIVENAEISRELSAEIEDAVARFGIGAAYAVRSSATAEDLPTASFAGQQDTYLNVIGVASVLEHIKRCWGSLFTERAVTYRLRNGVDHRTARMAVVVERMVFPSAAGILFTANPISGSRRIAVVEASVGLGEALVSGLTNPDSYNVRDGTIISKTIAAKQVAIVASPAGGTRRVAIDEDHQRQPALSDAQVVRLAALGRRIEADFGRPQDIEWCLADDEFQILQSRPITTLFPIPDAGDDAKHVYLSVGHQQMMTDAMRPLGISVWQMIAVRPMAAAGGRLFVDVAATLASPASRAGFVKMISTYDPLTGDALQTMIDRDFIPLRADARVETPPLSPAAPIDTDPAIVDELIARSERSVADLRREIRTRSGPALFDFIASDIQELKRILFDPRSHQVFMSAMEAAVWINDKIYEWLGEKNVADVLTQSVPNNITSEMGLDLLDVADVIRPRPEVVTFLERTNDDDFLNSLPRIAGGREARDAIVAWLDKYGMRCVGEIDITRTRWSERPSMLLPLILGNVRNFEPGAGQTRFEQGKKEALQKEQEILARLRALPNGEQKAEETKRMIDRVRTFIGYREYPKYGMVSRLFVYKQALLAEAERLVSNDVIRKNEDIFFLTFQEFHDASRSNRVDERLVLDRKDAFHSYCSLTTPRVLTSEGEIISGAYRRENFPPGALVGLAVSAGVVAGRARVISRMADADLDPGDILVTSFTDPSWTPLFVAIEGLVTEVGGLMTHGAVIAREYGLPAVVGVERATQLIRDGQRIRVNGTEGYVELLSD